jgi:hypothetical protein
MTNDQIPMTNEKDNNQLNKAKGGLPVSFFFGYWLLSVYLVIGIWSLLSKIIHFPKCVPYKTTV